MTIERRGVLYQIAMDVATIQDTAYCQLVAGRVELARQLLLSTIFDNEEAVDKWIKGTLIALQLRAQEAQQTPGSDEVASP